MAIKHSQEYRDPEISKGLIKKIKDKSKKSIRLMEVCGTHTMSLFRHGIRSVLPPGITILSGPGCPVCVTDQKEIDAFIKIAREDDVILTTFGDLMRVPGTGSSMQKERSKGRDIRMVYSTFDAIEIARKNPDKRIVFPGVGFETTAPTMAASIISAKDTGVDNFFLYSAHKLVPPALFALMDMENVNLDGFILPGHVSVIIGEKGYIPFFEKYRIPSVIAGFEPGDILHAILQLVTQVEDSTPSLSNAYGRAVSHEGNQKAVEVMNRVFEVCDATWRGIGEIPQSGLKIRKEYAPWNAQEEFTVDTSDSKPPKGCKCGDILTGHMTPPECPLYKKVCTPVSPVGPCMVSSEGTCAAYYRFHSDH